MRSLLYLVPAVVLLAVAACEYEPDSSLMTHEEPAEREPDASGFDPAKCGTVVGRVVWSGPMPVTPPFIYGVPNADHSFTMQTIPNPNRPAIDETSRAVAGAVVYLRGVSPAAAKPWNLPPVRIEMKNRGIAVIQGEREGRVGFVRRGDGATMVSVEEAYHVLRARGAANFSLAFPDENQPLTRVFNKPGRVELSSGAGYYWASADLFVVEHPYYAITDRDGRFLFDQVPAGPVEVAAWLPGWEAAQRDREPETGLISRQWYSAPLERVSSVEVKTGRVAEANFTFGK
ncbi:MAG TPA: carboxypeptidase-like regulatory domain-containing protein [Gemmataceae bacterium]|jgi:hypothetical protein